MAFSFPHGVRDPMRHQEKPGIGWLEKSVGGGERLRRCWFHSTPIPGNRQAGRPAGGDGHRSEDGKNTVDAELQLNYK